MTPRSAHIRSIMFWSRGERLPLGVAKSKIELSDRSTLAQLAPEMWVRTLLRCGWTRKATSTRNASSPIGNSGILMRERAITNVCERGIDDNEGEFRLSFFYRNRRARLSMDPTGRIIRRSIIDFGDRPIPDALHRPGG